MEIDEKYNQIASMDAKIWYKREIMFNYDHNNIFVLLMFLVIEAKIWPFKT